MSRARAAHGTPHVTVLLCRGCCCGTASKHPSTDHDHQEEVVRSAAVDAPGVAVRLVDCLDECDRSNVVVLRGAHGRPAERDTWLGGVLSAPATRALAAWIADGGAGALPPALAGLRFRHRRPGNR